jgi:hypothetical protein
MLKLSALKFTGIVCPACRESAALFENQTLTAVALYCPACQERWFADAPPRSKSDPWAPPRTTTAAAAQKQ